MADVGELVSERSRLECRHGGDSFSTGRSRDEELTESWRRLAVPTEEEQFEKNLVVEARDGALSDVVRRRLRGALEKRPRRSVDLLNWHGVETLNGHDQALCLGQAELLPKRDRGRRTSPPRQRPWDLPKRRS